MCNSYKGNEDSGKEITNNRISRNFINNKTTIIKLLVSKINN